MPFSIVQDDSAQISTSEQLQNSQNSTQNSSQMHLVPISIQNVQENVREPEDYSSLSLKPFSLVKKDQLKNQPQSNFLFKIQRQILKTQQHHLIRS